LPSEHPQRIADLRTQAAIEIFTARPAFETIPKRNRGAKVGAQQRILQSCIDILWQVFTPFW
jgi:hypothetical protein